MLSAKSFEMLFEMILNVELCELCYNLNMGKNCCTVFDNKSSRSGYSSDKSGIRVITFPASIEEKTRWVMNLPDNVLKVEEVTEHIRSP